MTIQRQAARVTLGALAALFSAARHIPEDRRNWSPMGEARTVQSPLFECTLTPPFYIAAAQGKMEEFAAFVPDKDLKELWRQRSERAGTLEGAEAVAQETFAELCQALESIPDEHLTDVQPHPMGLTRSVTTADLLFLAYWNLVYHTGQINYLQTMLGDTEQRVECF